MSRDRKLRHAWIFAAVAAVALLWSALSRAQDAGPPMHGPLACDAACKVLTCRELAKAGPAARFETAVAECVTLEPCPPACTNGGDL